MSQPRFTGLHFFVRDMARATAFYERLGFKPVNPSEHATRMVGHGDTTFFLGSYDLTRGYDANFREPSGMAATALQFDVDSREEVDALYRDLIANGCRGRLAPFDAFWGTRYMEVYDPDGNIVGVHSPRDESMVSPPPV